MVMSSSTSLDDVTPGTKADGVHDVETQVTSKGGTVQSIQEGETVDITIDASVQRSIVRKLDTR